MSERPPPKFKIGDKVKIADPAWTLAVDVIDVRDAWTKPPSWHVYAPGLRGGPWFRERDLVLADEK